MSRDNPYKNLSRSDLELADHYAETGNSAGLRQMREKSERQGQRQTTIIIRGNVSNNQNNDDWE